MIANCFKTVVVCIKGGHYGCLPNGGRKLAPYNADGGTIESPAENSTITYYGDIFSIVYMEQGQQGVQTLARCLEEGLLALKQTPVPVLFDGNVDEVKTIGIKDGHLEVIDPSTPITD